MKRSKSITLYLMSSVLFTSCGEQTKKTYSNVQNCAQDYKLDSCNMANSKAKAKDLLKSPLTYDECVNKYKHCEIWKQGYAPAMRGFIVRLPNDGEPYYELQRHGHSKGYGGSWGGKPRAGGFGQHGHSVGG